LLVMCFNFLSTPLGTNVPAVINKQKYLKTTRFGSMHANRRQPIATIRCMQRRVIQLTAL